ncbi:pyridoxamine 5'-phosphate oxidase family protein [Pseudonocardia petroleophila]|uniref:Pyridoxamine 5'-phosphate oxidase family protein n=1 Tax=Pseudonocardia petroleophila TaxID=37331 RepID=A0A7G7MQU0_9PSEU|nr:pyridoxamine 5'-phosphate oxidase family protein [Pseudonocardia petroleophila]QNG55151.1 pyridoxamine 5'-phosphate oxidase family protein [Pseudonocardia petroleophila]
MDTRNLADRYALPALDWSSVTDRLGAGFGQAPGAGGPDRHTTWLTTLDPDGGPHVTAVGALWVDGCLWFETGETTRKGRNLARDPRCTAAISTREFDLVVAGTAEVVTERDTVARLAAAWAEDGWPCEVDESGTALTAPFSAPSAGGPPWAVYRLTARSAHAVATVEPGGATRWTF